MLNKEQILAFLKENKSRLYDEFAINTIGLFGSFASNNYNSDSDVDIVISFQGDATNLHEKKISLQAFLEQAFRRDVDLCSEKYIKPYFRERILNTAIYV